MRFPPDSFSGVVKFVSRTWMGPGSQSSGLWALRRGHGSCDPGAPPGAWSLLSFPGESQEQRSLVGCPVYGVAQSRT